MDLRDYEPGEEENLITGYDYGVLQSTSKVIPSYDKRNIESSVKLQMHQAAICDLLRTSCTAALKFCFLIFRIRLSFVYYLHALLGFLFNRSI